MWKRFQGLISESCTIKQNISVAFEEKVIINRMKAKHKCDICGKRFSNGYDSHAINQIKTVHNRSQTYLQQLW